MSGKHDHVNQQPIEKKREVLVMSRKHDSLKQRLSEVDNNLKAARDETKAASLRPVHSTAVVMRKSVLGPLLRIGADLLLDRSWKNMAAVFYLDNASETERENYDKKLTDVSREVIETAQKFRPGDKFYFKRLEGNMITTFMDGPEEIREPLRKLATAWLAVGDWVDVAIAECGAYNKVTVYASYSLVKNSEAAQGGW